MIRHARMSGRPTLWLPGLDHASIAAQVVLDRILATEGESRASASAASATSSGCARSSTRPGPSCASQQERVGASLDWGRLRFTMDEGRRGRCGGVRAALSTTAWRTAPRRSSTGAPAAGRASPTSRSSPTPETGTLWTIRYHLVGRRRPTRPRRRIAVATTRPETILGDIAVAVHPDDPRYAALVGRRVLIPFVDRDVPVIADDVVDRASARARSKITPAHDHDDCDDGRAPRPADDRRPRRRGADQHAGGRTPASTGYEARRGSWPTSRPRGDLVGDQPHEMVIGRCQRSDDVVEPRLKTQWFIRRQPLAARPWRPCATAGRGSCRERFEKVWEHWLTEIRDWNVSRQLWWGHRIPAWYCPDGHVTVSDAGRRARRPARCAAGRRPSWPRTRTSSTPGSASGLWPFSTLGWPEETPDLARFYPGTVMETGYDIIFFWVARMMMLGIQLTGRGAVRHRLPVGLVRDPYGQKMSKTKGNVVDPLGVIDEWAPTRCASPSSTARRPATTSGSAPRSSRTPATSRNKLWNAARFVLGARPRRARPTVRRSRAGPADLGPAERWLLADARATRRRGRRAPSAEYSFGEATRVLYDAIWSEYCDWGLELAKVRLADDGCPAAEREATWWALVEALDTLPAAAPSGDALRDRGDLAAPAAPRRRPRAAHRGRAGRTPRGARRWPRRPGRGDRALSSSSEPSATRAPRPASDPPSGWPPSCRCPTRPSAPPTPGWPCPSGRLTRLGPVDVADGGLAPSDGDGRHPCPGRHAGGGAPEERRRRRSRPGAGAAGARRHARAAGVGGGPPGGWRVREPGAGERRRGGPHAGRRASGAGGSSRGPPALTSADLCRPSGDDEMHGVAFDVDLPRRAVSRLRVVVVCDLPPPALRSGIRGWDGDVYHDPVAVIRVVAIGRGDQGGRAARRVRRGGGQSPIGTCVEVGEGLSSIARGGGHQELHRASHPEAQSPGSNSWTSIVLPASTAGIWAR